MEEPLCWSLFHLVTEQLDWLLTTGLFWLGTITLFSGLGTDVHFSGNESGMHWEDYLFELQNAVEWRIVMSRGPYERRQMHVMSVLLCTCVGVTDRTRIDDGARWALQGASRNIETELLV